MFVKLIFGLSKRSVFLLYSIPFLIVQMLPTDIYGTTVLLLRIISGLPFLIWLYMAGTILIKNVNNNLKSIFLFKSCVVYMIMYLIFIMVFIKLNLFVRAEGISLLLFVVFHILSLVSIFLAINFVSKYMSLYKNKNYIYTDKYWTIFILLCLFPIGMCYLNPQLQIILNKHSVEQ